MKLTNPVRKCSLTLYEIYDIFNIRGDKIMTKSNREHIKQAKKHLKKIRELVAQRPSPFEGMTEEDVIERLRKTRKELWEKKLVTHT